MATGVPASLKSADINRFALRAAQIEKAKPAVAYWCNYWIVQQIVVKSLHNTDDESKAYTSGLMDKLEEMKVENAEDDAISDDVAGKALLEQFGLDIFNKAENAMRANKVTRQTADTFLAGATFLELLQIWPPVDPEITAKIKFAKYHALRIAKALKAGEDPNLSNPSPDPTPTQETAPLDPNDPEVQALGGSDVDASQGTIVSQAYVEDVPDEHDHDSASLARTSNLDESLHPSRAPSVPPPGSSPYPTDAEHFYHDAAKEEVSPLGPESADRAPPSVGGGYFPRIPDVPQSGPPSLPQPPPDIPGESPGFDPSPSAPPSLPYQAGFSSHSSHIPTPPPPVLPPYPQRGPQHPYSQAPAHVAPPTQPSYHQPPAQLTPYGGQTASTYTPQPGFVPDEEAIAKAQKHARWAISALNFEDVKTAIEELEGALRTLGAR